MQPVLPSSTVDVAVIGAGPYGLSIASHLQKRGIEHRIFGTPMQAWRSMSAGMHLKSVGFATSIPTADPLFTLPEYCRVHDQQDHEPIPIATFAQYGEAVQQLVVPHLEQVDVVRLTHEGGAFQVTLASGEVVSARHVVVA